MSSATVNLLIGVGWSTVVAAASMAAFRVLGRRGAKPTGEQLAAIEQRLRDTGADLPSITPEAHARIRDRVTDLGEGRAAALGRRARSGWPRSTPLPPLDTTDYVKRAQDHQPCTGWPCDHEQWHNDTPAAYTISPHCRCGAAWVCELAGPLNVPRQRAGEPYNRQDDPGRWW